MSVNNKYDMESRINKADDINGLKKFLYSEQIIAGFIASFILALSLELIGAFTLMLLAGAIGGVLIKRGWIAFVVGFVSVFLAWCIYFIAFLFLGPFSALLVLLETIIGIPGAILVIISLIIGGLLGGIGSLLGAYLSQLVLGENYQKKS